MCLIDENMYVDIFTFLTLVSTNINYFKEIYFTLKINLAIIGLIFVQENWLRTTATIDVSDGLL